MNRYTELNQIEIEVCESWLATGAIRLIEEGEENSYYLDLFDRCFYCKNL